MNSQNQTGTDALALLMMELFGLVPQVREGTHAHKCGFDVDDVHANGCGHEWTHDASKLESEEAYQQAHHCPNCGRGPWSWQLTPETIRERNRRAA